MSQQSYPVFVTVNEYRLVWVEADSAEEAEVYAREDSELWSSTHPYDGDWTAKAPSSKYDWDDLYGACGAAPKLDEHVHAHRRHLFNEEVKARRAACAEQDHPNLRTLRNGTHYCDTCGVHLDTEPAVSA